MKEKIKYFKELVSVIVSAVFVGIGIWCLVNYGNRFERGHSV